MKAERITWIDSYAPEEVEGWMPIKDVTKTMGPKESTIVTVGHVLKEKRGFLAVAGSVHDDRCCSIIVIPVCAIVSREEIRDD